MASPEFEQAMEGRGAAGAATIMQVYGPLLEAGITRATLNVLNAPADLNALLDARAKLLAFYHLREQLDRLARSEVDPLTVMEELVGFKDQGGFPNGG